MDWGEWEIRITHCFREANQVADKLANMGIECSLEVRTYHASPIEIREVCMLIRWALHGPDILKVNKISLGL